MKVFTQTGLTKLIQLIKANFVANNDVTTIDIDILPTEDSDNLITSGGVYDAIEDVHNTIDEEIESAVPSTMAASAVTAGTFAGQTKANASAVATLGTAQVRNIYAGTTDIGTGADLPAGDVYLVYQE